MWQVNIREMLWAHHVPPTTHNQTLHSIPEQILLLLLILLNAAKYSESLFNIDNIDRAATAVIVCRQHAPAAKI